MGSTRGVEIRPNSIRLHFSLDGKPHKETLKTDGAPLAPIPANLKYAHRMVSEIREKIRHGTFCFSDYFPDSPRATTGRGLTVGEHLDNWIKLHPTKADSTISAYRVAVEFWKQQIGQKPLKALRHSDILAALASRPEWTGKTRNNKSSVLRQALGLALRDGLIVSSPIDGLEAAAHQYDLPDPLSLEEAEAVIDYLRKRRGDGVANYFEFKFFSGLRTGESLAIQWGNIDFNRRQMLVSESITLGLHKKTTKTNRTRIVELNSRAMGALMRQKPATFLLEGGWIFRSETGDRWADDSGPRKIWAHALRALGIRHRSPYHTRHTYATIMLMSGVTPAYGAKQLGHTIEMFLRTYSKWLDGGQNTMEMNKVEAMIGAPKFPQAFPGNG